MSKEITCDLSTKSLNEAIRELEKYQKWLERKTTAFAEELAMVLQKEAQMGFNMAAVDDTTEFGFRQSDVNVTVENAGDNIRCVVANGDDAVFIEFGAGVHYNGTAGSSPHPNGSEFGFTIGSYGKHQGRYDSWAYLGEDGKYHISHGTPAQMPMYTAMMTVMENFDEIARRVFA